MEIHDHVQFLLPSLPSTPALSPSFTFDSFSSEDRSEGTATPPLSPLLSLAPSGASFNGRRSSPFQSAKKRTGSLAQARVFDEPSFSPSQENYHSSFAPTWPPYPETTTQPPSPSPSLSHDSTGQDIRFSVSTSAGASGSPPSSDEPAQPISPQFVVSSGLPASFPGTTAQPDAMRPAKRRIESRQLVPNRSREASSSSGSFPPSSSSVPSSPMPSSVAPPLLRRITAPVPSFRQPSPQNDWAQPELLWMTRGRSVDSHLARQNSVPLPDRGNPNLKLFEKGSYPPVELPPKPYSGPSPFMPPSKSPPTIYASQMDRLPALEARMERMELGLREYARRKGNETLRRVTLDGEDTQGRTQRSDDRRRTTH